MRWEFLPCLAAQSCGKYAVRIRTLKEGCFSTLGVSSMNSAVHAGIESPETSSDTYHYVSISTMNVENIVGSSCRQSWGRMGSLCRQMQSRASIIPLQERTPSLELYFYIHTCCEYLMSASIAALQWDDEGVQYSRDFPDYLHEFFTMYPIYLLHLPFIHLFLHIFSKRSLFSLKTFVKQFCGDVNCCCKAPGLNRFT